MGRGAAYNWLIANSSVLSVGIPLPTYTGRLSVSPLPPSLILLAQRKSGSAVLGSMLPPDFVRQLEAKGTHPPHCWECVNVANIEGLDLLCVKYEAYVLLYSSCSSHERREKSNSPILSKAEVARRFRCGLNELRK